VVVARSWAEADQWVRSFSFAREISFGDLLHNYVHIVITTVLYPSNGEEEEKFYIMCFFSKKK
jgi:hypothetical protein